MLSKVFNPFLYFKYKNKLKNNILFQSSYLKYYTSKFIKIENYLMKKIFNSFLDFNNEYFFRYARRDYLLYEKLSNQLHFQEKEFIFKPDLFFLDVDKEIFTKSIAKNLFLLEVDKKQTILIKKTSLIEDFTPYVLGEIENFYSLSLDILKDFSLSDLRTALGNFSNSIALFKQMLTKEKENEEFSKIFRFDLFKPKIENYYDYIFLNSSYKISISSLSQNPYFCILGSPGSGKSFLLMHILFNIILSRKYKRIIFFDTQQLFEEYLKKLKPNYFEKITKTKEIYPFYLITEDTLFINEIELYNLLNFLLEKENLTTAQEKKRVIGINIKDKTKEEILEELKIEKENYEKLKDYKELQRLNFLNNLIEFVENIKIREYSLFEEIEKGIFIFSFQNLFYYEIISFLFFKELQKKLYNKNEKETFLFLDETQKYLNSPLILYDLIKLMQEKRQFGFRLFYTGLSYHDIKELLRYTHFIILNDISDIYLRNLLKNIGFENEINKPYEKIITDTNFTSYKLIKFENFLFRNP